MRPAPATGRNAALEAATAALDAPFAVVDLDALDAGACAVGQNDRFYSYRMEGRAAGRMLGFVGLRAG